MPARDGAAYLSGLRDRREIWLGGERVADVANHPGLARGARAVADLYDYQTRSDSFERMTYRSPSSGDTAGAPSSSCRVRPADRARVRRCGRSRRSRPAHDDGRTVGGRAAPRFRSRTARRTPIPRRSASLGSPLISRMKISLESQSAASGESRSRTLSTRPRGAADTGQPNRGSHAGRRRP